MIKVDVQKNLLGLEDLLLGTGTVEQQRGPSTAAKTTITKINGANFPYDDNETMQQKIDALQAAIDSIPAVVDTEGDFLTGFLNSSSTDLNLANRLWRKTIDANTVEIYYGTELILQYDPSAGNIIVPGNSDYIAADAAVTSAFEAADDNLQASIDAINDALGTAHDKDAGTSAGNVLLLDEDDTLPALSGEHLTDIPVGAITGLDNIPVGFVGWSASSTAPTNWLECDGSAISRTGYSELFDTIGTVFGAGDGSTTFELPDLRGVFIRGHDNTRGLDSGRLFGTYQQDEFKLHTHGVRKYYVSYQSSGPVLVPTSETARPTDTTGASGGDETRPKNVALLPIIKAQ